ncbi:hypothetical protein V6N12_016213 [Hibiscus sabdariffa]|uniref:Uncharacterized protein n=1 Tax=Hibiscus sabdariffa TaxID=183260 RepID=A0ABR2C9C6_9ROSI
MCMGTASSDWAGGGDGGGNGAEPKGEFGVASLLAGPASSWAATIERTRLVGGVGIVILMGAGTAALRQRAVMMQAKARIPLSFLQSSCQLFGYDFTDIETVARYDSVD